MFGQGKTAVRTFTFVKPRGSVHWRGALISALALGYEVQPTVKHKWVKIRFC